MSDDELQRLRVEQATMRALDVRREARFREMQDSMSKMASEWSTLKRERDEAVAEADRLHEENERLKQLLEGDPI